MHSNGVYLKEMLDLDGKIKRFKADDKDSGVAGWAVGFRSHVASTGQEYFNVVYGNFKTGETYHYKSDSKGISKEELKKINQQFEKAKMLRELEIEKDQKQAAESALSTWNSLQPTDKVSDYLSRKKINELFGAKFTDAGSLIIPVRDINGNITSLQSINDKTGDKKFFPNGKIKACFHTIGDIDESDYILICEGYATGASIHMATGKPVVVAFQSTNLENVAVEIANKYKTLDKKIIICGDDDAYTVKPPNNEPYNAGRIFADRAADTIQGAAVYPKFGEHAARGLTDFNDLHKIAGLDAVTACFNFDEKKSHVFVRGLGHCDGVYYFVSDKNKQIQYMGASSLATKSGLMRLQPLEYWQQFYMNDKGALDIDSATNDMMKKCHAMGVFKPESIRGAGVWEDDGRIIYNAGDCLFYNGEKYDLHSSALKTRQIYNLDSSKPELEKPLTKEESSLVYEVTKNINAEDLSAASKILAGWLFIAPIAGALNWRPHMWLTGASGTGKSYLMEEFIFRLIKKHSVYLQGGTTEAGMRAATSDGSFPVIFDEFETNDQKSKERVSSIVELARQASSSGAGLIIKSSSSGTARVFKPQFAMLVSSVRVGLEHEEDKNRFSVIDLKRGGTPEQFGRLNNAIKDVFSINKYSEKLFSRALENVDKIKESYDILKIEIAKRVNMRKGQQYGTILAGYWHLTSDEVITIGQAKLLCEDVFSKQIDNENAEDEENCLNYLLDSTHDFENSNGKRKQSVRGAIDSALNNNEPFAADWTNWLAGLGIKIVGDELCLVHRNKNITDIYSKTKWAAALTKTLRRIEGSSDGFVKISGSTLRCIKIPLHIFNNKD